MICWLKEKNTTWLETCVGLMQTQYRTFYTILSIAFLLLLPFLHLLWRNIRLNIIPMIKMKRSIDENHQRIDGISSLLLCMFLGFTYRCCAWLLLLRNRLISSLWCHPICFSHSSRTPCSSGGFLDDGEFVKNQKISTMSGVSTHHMNDKQEKRYAEGDNSLTHGSHL